MSSESSCKCCCTKMTPGQKVEIVKELMKVVELSLARYNGGLIIPESVQNTLKILFPRGIE